MCPLCVCARLWREGIVSPPPGSKQLHKTNIQQTVHMHPHPNPKKPWDICALTMELINISAAQPWLFMQALRGSNEAEPQRQCAQRPRLSSKGQNYLSDPRDESRSARHEPQLKWATGDLPMDESLWVGISVWESTDVAASDLLCQSPHASYAVCCQRTLNRTLWWKRCMQIEHAWWTDTESRGCSEITI